MLVLALLGGCIYRGWHRQYYDRANEDYFEPIGEDGVVQVGQRFDAAVVPGTDLLVEVTQVPLCRQAVFGRVEERQRWYRERDFQFNFWTPVAAILTTPLVPYSAYLWWRWIHNRRITDQRVIETVSVDPRSTWVSDVEPCPATRPRPGAHRNVRITVTFANTGTYYWYDVVTGPDGRVLWNNVAAVAARVATWCGTASLTVDDLTPDPAYVAVAATAATPTDVRGEVASPYDTGTPEAVKRIAFHQPSAALVIPGDGGQDFSMVRGGELDTLKTCGYVPPEVVGP